MYWRKWWDGIWTDNAFGMCRIAFLMHISRASSTVALHHACVQGQGSAATVSQIHGLTSPDCALYVPLKLHNFAPCTVHVVICVVTKLTVGCMSILDLRAREYILYLDKWVLFLLLLCDSCVMQYYNYYYYYYQRRRSLASQITMISDSIVVMTTVCTSLVRLLYLHH